MNAASKNGDGCVGVRFLWYFFAVNNNIYSTGLNLDTVPTHLATALA